MKLQRHLRTRYTLKKGGYFIDGLKPVLYNSTQGCFDRKAFVIGIPLSPPRVKAASDQCSGRVVIIDTQERAVKRPGMKLWTPMGNMRRFLPMRQTCSFGGISSLLEDVEPPREKAKS